MHDPPDPRGYTGQEWTDSKGRIRRPWISHEEEICGMRVTRYGRDALTAMKRDHAAGRMPAFRLDEGNGPQHPPHLRTGTQLTTSSHVRPRSPRPRSRRKRSTTRSSAKSGDSGDDGPGEPEPPRPPQLRRTKYGLVSPNLLGLLLWTEVDS